MVQSVKAQNPKLIQLVKADFGDDTTSKKAKLGKDPTINKRNQELIQLLKAESGDGIQLGIAKLGKDLTSKGEIRKGPNQ